MNTHRERIAERCLIRRVLPRLVMLSYCDAYKREKESLRLPCKGQPEPDQPQ